jgi:hypothetical protein
VALAALDLGIDLRGAVFSGGGETPTAAKVAPIAAAGARYMPTYYLSEIGAVGLACAEPRDATDVHAIEDCVAIVQLEAAAGDVGRRAGPLLYTTLLPTAPKLMLNVDSGDRGVCEERACSCALGEAGYRRHLRAVHSHARLTGEGMTLLAGDVIRVIEEELPARFGGSPLDYQLVEEETESGFTRLALLVHPRVVIADERSVVAVVFDALARGGAGSSLAAAVWQRAQALTVRREAPRLSAQGKFVAVLPAEVGARAPGGAMEGNRG